MAIKTYEELLEMLELVAEWVRARKSVDDLSAEYSECVKELHQAEKKLSEAVINAADSTDEQAVQEGG